MKRFTIRIIAVLIPLYLVCIFYKYYIEPNINKSGDLGLLGKINFGDSYQNSLKKNYLKKSYVVKYSFKGDNKIFRIASIGDSFSQQGLSGYQNYLGVIENRYILNFTPDKNRDYEPEQKAINLLNSGVFQKIKTKVVIIESVERTFIHRLNEVNFRKIVPFEDLGLNLGEKTNKIENEKSQPLLESITSWIRLSFNFENPVKKNILNGNLFSDYKNKNKLYFFEDDLLFTSVSEKEINIALINLLKIKKQFDSQGIKLIYVVSADKYDVYQSFILNNPYSKNSTLDHFKSFENMPFFLNTKNILLPMVKMGIKDVYKLNDTHWTYIASNAVAIELDKRIFLSTNRNK